MMQKAPHAPADPAVLDRILDEKGRQRENVIAVLQGIQTHYNYLPEPALHYIAAHSQITKADIVGVSSFYSQFRHEPAGRHFVNVCVGTACHVKGASRITDAFRRHLQLTEGTDTDNDNQFTVQEVNCLGCCSLAPAVQVDDVIYGFATTDNVGDILDDFLKRGQGGKSNKDFVELPAGQIRGDIRVCMGSCCVASGAATVESALQQQVTALRIPARVQPVSCIGLTYEEPLLEVALPDQQPTLYTKVRVEDIPTILHKHFPPPRWRDRWRYVVSRHLEKLYTDDAWIGPRRFDANMRDPEINSYLDPQVHIATACCGQFDPVNLEAYCKNKGFEALQRVLQEGRPLHLIDQIDASGLRGRGGGGYPTGQKWRAVANAQSKQKYVVCNGDEGDPGAFMDRMLLESYPYRIIEGMVIAGFAVGASQGVLYIRSEYPLAIDRINTAIEACRAAGWLGTNICGSGFAFDLHVMEGAGAFVCGEETALIASIEGKRGMPRLRPPWPSDRGLHENPTLVNNAETIALVPWILREGPEAFAAIGTHQSKGTKVFALAGKIRRGGMIEVPMGITIRQLIEDIGGGIADGHRLKAVQIGGPSGGCIPERLADTPIDYEALLESGAMMGSGGLVALDETDCMVEIARYFLAFTQHESCGKCTFCRIGTKRMLELLERICAGKGKTSDLNDLEHLAAAVKQGSLCGLGKSAPNPILTTLRYFRDEYEAHIAGTCPAGQCKALIAYEVTDDCIGCTKCAQICPADAIPLTPYEKHVIDDGECIRCDACRRTCPSSAIVITSGGIRVAQASTLPAGKEDETPVPD